MKNSIITVSAALLLGTMVAAASVRLSGRVLSADGPVAGVPVTDGVKFTLTDKNGKYDMESADDTRFVYITIPDGYKVSVEGGVPVFYAQVTPDAKGRFRHDFSLEKSDKDMNRQALFVMADPQVYFDPDLNEVEKAALEMKATAESEYADREVLGLCLGDIVGQISQGEKYFPWMIRNIAKTDFPYFYICGNHDIENGVPTNEEARQSFNRYFGPSYYSFNRGKVHYVVLDDTYWMGRYYAGYIEKKQLDWLRDDLAMVPEGSTVIVAQHIPCYSREARKQEWNKESYHKVVSNRQALFKLLKPYDAHIMSGHEHYNENYIFAGNLYEHCHAPLSTLFWCAPWAMDGTPGGYAVYEIEDGKIKDWHYKSVGFPKDYQMNVYPVGVSREHPEAIVANVWNYDSSWKVELLEDGVPTAEMTRFRGHDPNLWADVEKNGKSYAFPYLGCDWTEHLFFAVPQNPAADITVRATDGHGTVYTAKPKPITVR